MARKTKPKRERRPREKVHKPGPHIVSTRYIRVDWINKRSQWVAKEPGLNNYRFVQSPRSAYMFRVKEIPQVFNYLKHVLPTTVNLIALPTKGVRLRLESLEQKEARKKALIENKRLTIASRYKEIERGFSGSLVTVDLGSNNDLQILSSKVDCRHCGVCRDCLERLGKL